ncbi:hypothetical protein ABIF20_006210 [Bradyrhizobium japonicum]
MNGKWLLSSSAKPEAERELSEGRDRRIEHAVEHRAPPEGIGEQILEILKAHEDATSADRGVCEGEPDAEAERVGEEDGEQPDRRRETHRDEEWLVVEQPHQPGLLPVRQYGGGEGGHGHRVVVLF